MNNGYDPNRNHNNYSPYNGGYDPNGGYNNSQTNGYRPYDGGTYQNPNQGYGQNYGFAPNMGYAGTAVQTQARVSLAEYSKMIFLWMGIGLFVTFGAAFALMLYLTSGSISSQIEKLASFAPIYYGGIVVEIVLAIVLGFFVTKMSHTASLIMFFVYSLVSGITLTPILCFYDAGSTVFAFAATAMMFMTFAIYGIVTKRDLTNLGTILIIGLIFLVIYSSVMLLIGHYNSLLIGVLGIIIFIGLTAYDAQKIKKSYAALANDEVMLKKMSVNLALQLYLDFVNLFIYILRLFGKQR